MIEKTKLFIEILSNLSTQLLPFAKFLALIYIAQLANTVSEFFRTMDYYMNNGGENNE